MGFSESFLAEARAESEACWERALAELESEVKAKDAEILALKEQVASLQRVLAHRRDSDSGVGS